MRVNHRWVVLNGLLMLLLTLGFTAQATVERVDAIGITVSDMDRALAFYRDVLGFEPISDEEVTGAEYERLMGVFGLRMRVVRMRLGEEHIELIHYLAPPGRPMPADSRGNDLWFQHIAIIVSDMDKAYAHLREHKVQHASTGPQRLPDWNPNAGGIAAFYFRDPDGNFLEILEFPPDKGDPKWHRQSDRLFLGIDHTAIVVSDTDASLRFYRDQLGLKVVGASENYGPEQERLNNVFGARLRITALKAEGGGPGIEFLEYLAPPGGRPTPLDTRANDLWHWQVQLVAANPEQTADTVRQGLGQWISPGVIELAEDRLGYSKGLLLWGPDGHAMLIVSGK
jgi:catechol 2,3-dioxygenase-like lactoylglutathione lyase family enzyme